VKLYLTPELFGHRRGRFLVSLLAIQSSACAGLPDAGFVLMTGEQLQESGDLQDACVAWARQPGCTLLLLPPYKEGPILSFLDWAIEFSSDQPVALGLESVERIVAQEIIYRLQGEDGSNDAENGELGLTRFWKAHSNTGLIAATMLPLWSISLLNHADLVTAFLENLNRHTGKLSVPVDKEDHLQIVLHPQDLTVMVCCYGFDVATAARLLERLRTYTVPLLNLANFDLSESFTRLRQGGFLNDNGLTQQGLVCLQASNYWVFAEKLKGEA
jgi:hypothetical protein